MRIGTYTLNLANADLNQSAPANAPVVITFSASLNRDLTQTSISLVEKSNSTSVPLTFAYLDNDKSVSITSDADLKNNTEYLIKIKSSIRGVAGETFPGFEISFKTIPGTLTINAIQINTINALNSTRIMNINPEAVEAVITFSDQVDASTVTSSTIYFSGTPTLTSTVTLSADLKTATLVSTSTARDLMQYKVLVSNSLRGKNGETFANYSRAFYTAVNPTPDFPLLTDDELLTKVQQSTFKYFWDFGHPTSGMARERNSSGDVVTSGGTGFGLMALVAGVHRNFITREESITRFEKIINFLEDADRFHGAWPHWMNGNTGKVIPFSANDNGGDLVETAFLVQGLLTVRQFLDAEIPTENALISKINTLWEGVEWDWYTRGQNVIYWHWSPDKQWTMNLPIRGYNEGLIVYVLAAASPTHSISTSVYTQGWANNGGIRNNKTFYNITLPLGFDYGGPLFFAHYSFLGLNPTNLSDVFGDYMTQNVNHTNINRAYCIANPKNFIGYTTECWGLTASDNQSGYSAHSPTNDLGVISPTAALSSMPYTPEASIAAMRYFYYTLGDRLWGEYGFYDAFNLTEGWVANSYLAIDQGPIVVMIENYRTGLLWDYFMSAPEIASGLQKLEFN